MRFFADRLDAFAWGMAAGWLVTYLRLTHERRTIKNVRKAVDYLASYHDLTPAKSRTLVRKDWATGEEIWEACARFGPAKLASSSADVVVLIPSMKDECAIRDHAADHGVANVL
jgi:hypothetical protein